VADTRSGRATARRGAKKTPAKKAARSSVGGGRPADPVTRYARDVTAGKIVAAHLVRLACQRHLDDVKAGQERGLEWRPKEAIRAIQFFADVLYLPEGEDAEGNPVAFHLSPFQQFIVGSLFGWFGADGYRRYRTAYVEIGKGNGKSPLGAGIGLLMLLADGEVGAQVYSAATTRDQAKIVWGDASKMVQHSPSLRARVVETVNNLAFHPKMSFFRPVSSDASKLDGFRPSCVIIDELHEHPNAKVVDKMQAGFKGRKQPLQIEITNSGVDRNSVCFQHHEYSRKVLEGTLVDDHWFAFVCGLDPCDACRADGHHQPREGCEDCDDWRDEAVWPKANPNLGISVTVKYLRQQVREATGMPAKLNTVLRLNFCMWTQQVTRWLARPVWDACNQTAIREAHLVGRRCFGALDLASTEDIAACVYVFPDTVEREVPIYPTDDESGTELLDEDPIGTETRVVQAFDVLARFWVPEESLLARVQRDRVPYDVWRREGFLDATEGNVIDYDVIRRRINRDSERFEIVEIAADRWNAAQIMTQLGDDGFTIFPFGQGFASMAGPSKELERVLRGRLLNHGGNPILTWMADNVAVEHDAAGNIKPSKIKSTERIDGIVALVMALARAMLAGPGKPKGSIYDRRGVRVV
jgi:phage terminase large subunit-like protein